jgi:hypothetical protein
MGQHGLASRRRATARSTENRRKSMTRTVTFPSGVARPVEGRHALPMKESGASEMSGVGWGEGIHLAWNRDFQNQTVP